jgi:type I restriction enzyme S subunit
MIYKVNQLCEINSNNLKKNHNLSYIDYLDTANLNEGIINSIQRLYFEKDIIPSRAQRIIIDNDILFSTVRPNQLHYGLIKKATKNLICSTGFAVLTPNNKVVPYYLYKYLTQKNIIEYLQGIAETSTSTYPSIKPSDIGEIEIDLPEIENQKKVAKILLSLDEKIELNNKINSELDELAQTLYKRWFVDFEFPNEEGKPYKSSGGQMVDSELGLIPKNWEIKNYSEFFDIKYGKSIYSSKDKTEIGEYKVYGAGGVISKTDHFDYEKSEIIVGCRGTCGNVNLTEPKSKITHNSLIIRANKRYKFFSYLSIKILDLSPFITGSTQPQITIKDLSKNKIIIPNEKNVLMFEMLTVNFFDKIFNLEKQNDKLSNLRDLLLPKLMSGEIEVPDME